MSTFKRKKSDGTWEYIGLPANVAMSPQTLAYAERDTSQTGITAETDLTGLSVTVTVPAGRRLRISGVVPLRQITSTGIPRILIHQDGVQVRDAFFPGAAAEFFHINVEAVVSPAAGTHTYKLRASTNAGSLETVVSATNPATILVEDITGSTLPYQPSSVPVGTLAWGMLPADQSVGTTATAINGCTLNVTVPAGRVLKISAHANMYNSTASGNQSLFASIYKNGVEISALVVLQPSAAGAFGDQQVASGFIIDSPSAGTHTYQLRAGASNTGMLMLSRANNQTYIVVEDITPTPAPANTAPSSTLGYAQVTANQGTFTAETDITGLSTTVTVPAGRRLRITAQTLPGSSVATDKIRLRIKEGATTLQFAQGEASPQATTLVASAIVSPSAGSHTYNVSLARDTGTGNITNNADPTFPSFILVEDITAAGIVAGNVPAPTLENTYLKSNIVGGGLVWDQPAVARSSAVSIANTETSIISKSVPANTLRVGSVFRLKAIGLWTNTTAAATAVIRVRFGSTTLTGNVAAGISMAGGTTARTNIPFMIDAMVTVLSTGAAGTVLGAVIPSLGNVVAPVLSAPVTAAVALDTTATKLIELTFISGAATTTANVLAATITQEV